MNRMGRLACGSIRLGGLVPSSVVTMPPALLFAPIISGDVRIGEVLSSDTGVWSNSPTSFARQWTRDGAPIGGATSATYTVVAADIACEIACKVTATNAGGSSAPEPSNALASPWRGILLARPGVLIYDHTDPYCSGGASVGDPVSEIRTVDGVVIGTQALSSARPTRTSGGLSFDGMDDYLICDAHAPLLDGAHTVCVGFDDPEDTSTAIRTLFCASETAGTTAGRQASLNYSRPGSANATRQRWYVADSGGGTTAANVPLTSLSPIGAGPYDLAMRGGAPGGDVRVDKLESPLVQVDTTKTRPSASPPTFDWLYLGCRPVGSAQYWQGVVRHLAIHDESWSDTDTSLYRTCAIAAGVM